jgi:hypothetical protein
MPHEPTILEQLNDARQSVTALTSERDQLRGQITQLTSDRDALTAKLAASPNASQGNFDQRLATELAKHGIKANAVAAENPGASAKTLSLTEQCLAITQGKDQINRA